MSSSNNNNTRLSNSNPSSSNNNSKSGNTTPPPRSSTSSFSGNHKNNTNNRSSGVQGRESPMGNSRRLGLSSTTNNNNTNKNRSRESDPWSSIYDETNNNLDGRSGGLKHLSLTEEELHREEQSNTNPLGNFLSTLRSSNSVVSGNRSTYKESIK